MSDEPNTGDGMGLPVEPPSAQSSATVPAVSDPGSVSAAETGAADQDGPVTGRASGVGITLLLFGLLVASWLVQLSFALQGEFGPSEDRLSGGGMLVGFVLGAAIAIGSPIVVLILQARVHKRTPRHSIVAAVGAIVVLVIAVPINAVVVGLQAVSVISGG
ncbi:hypothetical protein PlfCFBP13513_10865 [Plantibacter flavus]|uniref:hypothetical protein n=1 Tax=Plantibacter TaxID=190323 RepID=UPI0010C23F85|nr:MULTISPECIES: hypothetical protein [Plantibacter]MBD8101049.1 hypothetical protein [Plantibacter sp. CFBP 8775]TKJ99824.1 hypothetical protein PlfCFBP13513_10865 [Plantibacter flavus]